jgi:hypothetical protein
MPAPSAINASIPIPRILPSSRASSHYIRTSIQPRRKQVLKLRVPDERLIKLNPTAPLSIGRVRPHFFDRISYASASGWPAAIVCMQSCRGGALKSESSARAERGVSGVRSRRRSLFLSVLFSSAIALAILAVLSAQLAAQTSAQSPASPPQLPAPPPGGVNLDAIGARKLPAGPGKQIVENSCKDCHTFDRITSAHHSLARWRVIVREMEQRGADVEPGDMDTLLHYLAQNFGVRHATAKPASAAPSHPPSQ